MRHALRDRIHEALALQPMTLAQLAKGLGVTISGIRQPLYALRDKRVVRITGSTPNASGTGRPNWIWGLYERS